MGHHATFLVSIYWAENEVDASSKEPYEQALDARVAVLFVSWRFINNEFGFASTAPPSRRRWSSAYSLTMNIGKG